ncbi:DoxX family protein [Pseudomaricurvus alkylphenolicus]|jgi:hypothetical protein|uniref:DoxX-like family protein n=1 Tax=Pseudomaricurvus alkylphenolicus TaxID=1306991 RepID=UPI00141FE6E8|nr:DoxX-like family protein [Pseudomaricurvus alkylphenolicus]NIB39869.1 DoxX family protein [Pseudomaricurvus alkylphenolicus]
MKTDELAFVSRACRWCLGFVFVFHGLFPKIVWLSDVEVSLVEAGGFGLSAQLVSPIAGMGEIVLGLLIILWKSSKIPIYTAFVSLVLLLLYVAAVDQALLFEAFNPVTTNISAMVMCYLVLRIEHQKV